MCEGVGQRVWSVGCRGEIADWVQSYRPASYREAPACLESQRQRQFVAGSELVWHHMCLLHIQPGLALVTK